MTRIVRALLGVSLALVGNAMLAQTLRVRSADLFLVERIGAITWSADNHRAAIEITHPGRWLSSAIPTSELDIVNAQTATVTKWSPTGAILGFFGAAWSPNGSTLAFLSIDTNAVVRPWIWNVNQPKPNQLKNLQLHDGLVDRPTIAWTDDAHVIVMARDSTQPNAGPLYVAIQRDRNAADQWGRARDGSSAAVTVTDSHDTSTSPRSQLLSVDTRTGAARVIASGHLHHATLSLDRRTLTYWREWPPLSAASIANILATPGDVDAAYLRVDWGGEAHSIDVATGAPVLPPNDVKPPPRDTTLVRLRFISTTVDGSKLVLARAGQPDTVLWRGNAWAAGLTVARAEPIAYRSKDGQPLTGWILYPPGVKEPKHLPVVTMIYPGTMLGPRVPPELSPFVPDFEHPRLFAALGYAVLLPSMPVDPKRQASSFATVANGVLPLVDTVVRRGIADSTRIALLGQSAGGYATLALITQTNRFRTAIASGAYANLASLYGTFYGEYRLGDAGSPLTAQALRILQLEKGAFGAPGPPWEHPDWYHDNSPISFVDRIHTPVMLIKGEDDFVPVQQAEEFFTALYRQGKHVELVRYAGEGHTIDARANVLDMWKRMEAWLKETMPQ